jgi:hypothetical protein
MILYNLPDSGPSHSGRLLGLSEFTRGGTACTNPHHSPTRDGPGHPVAHPIFFNIGLALPMLGS